MRFHLVLDCLLLLCSCLTCGSVPSHAVGGEDLLSGRLPVPQAIHIDPNGVIHPHTGGGARKRSARERSRRASGRMLEDSAKSRNSLRREAREFQEGYMSERRLLGNRAIHHNRHGWLSLRRRWPVFKQIAATVKKVGAAVTKHVKAAVATVTKVVKQVVNLPNLIKLGIILKNAFFAIKPCMDCINKLPNKKYQLQGLFEFFTSFKGDFIQFTKQFSVQYIQPMVDGVKKWIKKLTNDPGSIKGTMGADQTIPVNEMQGGNGSTWMGVMMDGLYEQIAKLVNEPGMDPAVCIEKIVVKPAYLAVKPLIISTIGPIVATLQKQWDALVKEATEIITKGIETFVTKNPQFDEMLAEIKKVANLECTKKLEQTGKDLAAPGANADELLAKVTQTEADGGSAEERKLAIKALASHSVKFFEKVADKLVVQAIEKAIKALQSLVDWGLNSVDAMCGFMPEIGGAICAPITAGIKTAQTFISTTLYDLGKKSVLAVFKMLTSMVERFVAAITSPETSKVLNNDLMKGALKAFKPISTVLTDAAKYMMPKIKDAMFGCQKTQQNLVKVLDLGKKTPATTATTTTTEAAEAADAADLDGDV